MKWITCSLIGAVPTVAEVCRLLAAHLAQQIHRHALGLEAPLTMPERSSLMVSGLVAFSMAMAILLPGRKLFLPILRNRLRMFMVTSPKSILTGQGV